jgi:hypothetical protein
MNSAPDTRNPLKRVAQGCNPFLAGLVHRASVLTDTGLGCQVDSRAFRLCPKTSSHFVRLFCGQSLGVVLGQLHSNGLPLSTVRQRSLTEAVRVEHNTSPVGVIALGAEFDAYTFPANAGDEIRAKMSANQLNYETYLPLIFSSRVEE